MADYFEEMGWTPLADGETPNQLLHFARLLRDFGMFEELGEDKRLPPPASRSAVESLPETEIKSKGTRKRTKFVMGFQNKFSFIS